MEGHAMKTDKNPLDEAAELRRRAEKQLIARGAKENDGRTDDENRRLLHELQVHQIELEMQNAELRQSRDEVEKALGEYTDLYDFAPVGYLTLDRAGIIRGANLTFASLVGIERSQLLDRGFGRLVTAEARPSFTDFLEKIFTSQTKEVFELALLKDGTGPLFVLIEAVADVAGKECRVAIVDISARRQLEAELETLHADLTARAGELEATNTELEAFNYSVSHDLRGPLTIVAGYCDVVEGVYGDKLARECREYIREIHGGTMRMSRIIDTLLRFSSVKCVELQHKKVDLSKMAKDVVKDLQVAEPERPVTFRSAAGITANGDAELLRLVLDNLIGNAWKYCGKKEEAVIEFGVTEVDGQPAYFVRDNGPGFDMALAARLFLPFQRLPGSDVEGHGIGLATVDRIISRHGGKVWAESHPGEGAIFYFTLG
jgi:PAS domain S-box-containing protein